MKKIFFVIATAAMMLVGCTKELTQRVEKVEQDLATLEDKVAALEKSLNDEVANLKTLIDAVENKIQVASATQAADGSWSIVLTNGKTIALTNGKDGKDGADGADGKDGANGADGKDGINGVTPGIVAVDGVLYWAIDGTPILVDGKMVPATGAAGADGEDGAAGADAPVPSFKIENGHLYVTVGETTTDLGQVVGADGEDGAAGEAGADGADGDAWFSSVVVNEDNVVITLADDETEIVLPLYSDFGLTVTPKPIALGGTVDLKYTVTGTEDYVVRAYASEDWTAVVDAKNSVVKVTASEDQTLYRAGWVDVYAIDNETGKVAAKSIVFSTDGTTLEVSDKVVVPAAGDAALEVGVSTDYVYDVKVDEAATWLKYVETKAVREETLVFSAEANKSGANRTATVELTVDGVVKATITFEQRALATAMTVEPKELEYVLGQGSVKFSATVTPADADQAVTYTVLNENGEPTSNFIFVGSEFQITDAEGVENYLNVLPGEYTVVVTSVSNPEVKVEVPVTVEAILIEEIKPAAELVKLKIGQVVALDYAVLPENSSDNTVVFTIDPDSDPNVISVDAEGNVKALAAGEAKVVITANDLYANNADPDTYVAPSAEVVFAISNELAVTELSFAKSEIDLHVNGVADVTVTAAPEAATNKSVEYTVLKDGKPTTELVVVDGKVKVNPEATNYLNVIAGKTYTVVATSVENPTVEAELTVNVYANYVESVELDAAEKTLNVAETATLVATVNPSEADDKTVKWYSSNEAVATVDQTGKVTAVAVGNAVITCESMDSFNLTKEASIKAECKVFVKTEDMEYAVTAITFPESELEIAIDDKDGVALNPEFNPADAPVTACTWTVKDAAGYTSNQLVVKDGKVSINPEVFTTMQDYAMVGKTYTVIATSTYDANVTASVEVTVTAVPVTTLTLGAETLEMYVGETYSMQYILGPENATDKTVKWDVLEGTAVTIDENGVIKAVAAGKAVVRLQSMSKYNVDTPAPTSVCEIVVLKKQATAIEFEKKSYDVFFGETLQLGTVITPADGDVYDHSVKYEVVAGTLTSNLKVDENGVVSVVAYNTTFPDATYEPPTYMPVFKDVNQHNTYTVRATLVSNPSVYAETTVIVKMNVPESVNISVEKVTMVVGDTFTPAITYAPANTMIPDSEFTLTAYGPVSVSGKVITAVSVGTTTVTVSAPSSAYYEGETVVYYPFGPAPSTTFEVEVIAAE